MRVFVLIASAATFAFSAKTLDASAADTDFCAYVEVFVAAMARNRAYNIPFIRVDEFDYFEVEKSRFLESVAHEVYAVQEIRNWVALVARHVEECEDAFPG